MAGEAAEESEMGVPGQVSQAVCGVMIQLTPQEKSLKAQYQMARNTHAKTSLPTGELAAAASDGRGGRPLIRPSRGPGPGLRCKEDDILWKQTQNPSQAAWGIAQDRDWGEAHCRCSINSRRMHEGLSPSPWDSLLCDSPTFSTRRATWDSLPHHPSKLPPIESTLF